MIAESLLQTSKATTAEATIRQIARHYPLNSGCGTIASSGLFTALASFRSANIWCDVAGFKSLVPLDDLVGRAMYFFGDLDPKVTWAFKKFVRPGDTVFDVGANLGLTSLQLLRQVGKAGAVHAFEPNPRMLEYLRETKAANPDAPLTVHPIALGAREETLELMIPANNFGAASFVDIGGRTEVRRIETPVMPLTEFCKANGIERVDFMKIDVEGFEADVLQGAETMLRSNPPRAIVLEDNDFCKKGKSAVFEVLAAWGFTVHALPKNLVRNRLVPLTHADARTAHDFVAMPASDRAQ